MYILPNAYNNVIWILKTDICWTSPSSFIRRCRRRRIIRCKVNHHTPLPLSRSFCLELNITINEMKIILMKAFAVLSIWRMGRFVPNRWCNATRKWKFDWKSANSTFRRRLLISHLIKMMQVHVYNFRGVSFMRINNKVDFFWFWHCYCVVCLRLWTRKWNERN